VFDLGFDGTETESEGGIEFHRIGRDLARELLNALPSEPGTTLDETGDTTSPSLAGTDLSVPRPTAAAFRAPSRRHEIPSEGPGALAEQQMPRSATSDEDPTSTSGDGSETKLATGRTGQENVVPDVFTGIAHPSPQYGILGEAAGRLVALDLNETHTISLFGVQGSGKSYTLGSIIEMATLAMPPVNRLPSPLATTVFHYSSTQDYAPEYASMVEPNDDTTQAQLLRERYGVQPAGLPDVIMLVPAAQVEERRAAYPRIRVMPLRFGPTELRAEHWRFLMGAVGNQSIYFRQLQQIMRDHRNDLRLDVIRTAVEHSRLPERLMQLALQRLDLATEYIQDGASIADLVRPGRMILVDLRDEFIEKDEALGLFVVLMHLFADAGKPESSFNKLVVFDEAHKYMGSPELVEGLVGSVREMRHRGTSVLIASQDPPSVPVSLIELSDLAILHKFTSPAWLKHLQKANAALAALTPAKLAGLAPGEAYLWASKATDPAFTRNAVRLRGRIRLTRHGGTTRSAAPPD
jgi:hypothetical protein